MEKLKIGIAFGGAICNSIKAKRNYARGYGRIITPEQTSRDTYPSHYPIREYDLMIQRLHSSRMTEMSAVRGTLYLKNLENKAEIYIVAIRTEHEASFAEKWLNEHKRCQNKYHNLFFNYFICTGDKTEAEICKEKGIQIFLGDSPGPLSKLKEQGIKVYLLRRPYNKHLDSDNFQGIEFVKSLREFVEKF